MLWTEQPRSHRLRAVASVGASVEEQYTFAQQLLTVVISFYWRRAGASACATDNEELINKPGFIAAAAATS